MQWHEKGVKSMIKKVRRSLPNFGICEKKFDGSFI
jgi:hypothetical protein